MREVLLAVIRLYKRFISPRKGFACAYRIHTGRRSCSSLGYRAVQLRGIAAGLAILQKRTSLCGVAQRRFSSRLRPLPAQRGVCDLGCDLPCDLNCDLPSPRLLSGLCDLSSCCDCGSCDWPSRKSRNQSQREKYVYIPPKVSRPKHKENERRSGPET